MARIRTIKPGHVNDKKLSEISLQAHLFWVLSWCFSDDEGVMENDPLLLRSQLFPRRTDIKVDDVQKWINQLIDARFVIPFEYEGDSFLLHRTFKNHQKIDRPQPSKIPFETIRRILDECSTNVQPCIVKESIVKDSKGEGTASPAPVKKIFIKPDVFETTNFFISLGLDEFTAQGQACLFMDYYNSNGWKVGKNPMKDWEAAARSWKNRMNNYSNSNNGTYKQSNNGSGSKPGTSASRLEALRNF
jgi:hypothetical protein